MPLTALFVHDVEWIRCNSHKAWIRLLTCPHPHPDAWVTSIRETEWPDVVARIYLTSSCADPWRDRSKEFDCLALLPSVCSSCKAALPSRRQLYRFPDRGHKIGEGRLVNLSMTRVFAPLVVRDLQTVSVLNQVATWS